MLTPVIHYLVEAIHSCSEMSHLPSGGLWLTLMGLVVILLAVARLRARARR